MKDPLVKGSIQGLIAAGIAYIFVSYNGLNTLSLNVLLYMFIVFGAFFEFKNSLDLGIKDFMGKVLIVAEEEEKTLKRVFHDKKYRVKGELEEI